MEEILSFIQTNYVWFIIGIVVIVMTIVGYFAEKTGFSFTEKGKSKNSEIDEETHDLNASSKEEGIADMIRENNEELSIPTYTEEETIEQPVDEISTQEINTPEQAEERINLEASDEDLYKPLSTTEEETTSDIPDELYAPIDSTENSKVSLENVTPFSITEEDSNEQVEDENSEYSRLFPSDPIIIDGEKKEEPEEEVAQEDIWNV